MMPLCKSTHGDSSASKNTHTQEKVREHATILGGRGPHRPPAPGSWPAGWPPPPTWGATWEAPTSISRSRAPRASLHLPAPILANPAAFLAMPHPAHLHQRAWGCHGACCSAHTQEGTHLHTHAKKRTHIHVCVSSFRPPRLRSCGPGRIA